MYRAILAVIVALALAGCTSTHKSVTEAPLAAKLASHSSFFVMRPASGRYGSKEYPDSGAAVAQAVGRALAPHADKVFQAPTLEDLSAVLPKAKQGAFKYVFASTILHWEDRATEWSGVLDKLSVKFEIYDADTGEKLAATVADASSKWATFGGDHPQDLLPEMTQGFVDSLF